MKKWKIEGYYGYSDFDGPADYNLHMEIELDPMFTADDIRAMLNSHFSRYRSTAWKVIPVWDEYEPDK